MKALGGQGRLQASRARGGWTQQLGRLGSGQPPQGEMPSQEGGAGVGCRVYRPESLSRAPHPHPQFLLSHWVQVAAEGRPPGETRAGLHSESHSGHGRTRPGSQPLRSSESAVQTGERKPFRVTLRQASSEKRQVTNNRQLGHWLWLRPVGTARSFTLLPRENLGQKTCLRACLFAQSVYHGPRSHGPDSLSGSVWLCPVEGIFHGMSASPGMHCPDQQG